MEFNKIKIFLLWFFIIFIGYLLSPAADSFETNFWNSILLIIAVIPLAVLVTFVQKWIFDIRKSTEGQGQIQNVQIFARRFYDLFSRWAIVILGLIAVYVNITFAIELSTLTSKEALGWAVLIFGPLCVIVNSFFYLGAVYFAYRKRVTTPIKLVTYIVTISIVAFIALSITGFIGTNPKDYEKNKLAESKVIEGGLVQGKRQYSFDKYLFSFTFPADWNLVMSGDIIDITPQKDKELLDIRLGRGNYIGLSIRPFGIKGDAIQPFLDDWVIKNPVGRSRKGNLNIRGQVYPFFVDYADIEQPVGRSLYFFVSHNNLFEASCSIDLAKGVTGEQCEKIITSIQFK